MYSCSVAKPKGRAHSEGGPSIAAFPLGGLRDGLGPNLLDFVYRGLLLRSENVRLYQTLSITYNAQSHEYRHRNLCDDRVRDQSDSVIKHQGLRKIARPHNEGAKENESHP